MPGRHRLDVVTIGRCSVDLYGEQVGGRLEEMGSFAKYVGGCPTNIAIGASRLGLRTALVTRVGDEHMGRFIKEELVREGVDVAGVATDPSRLTALVVLGIRDKATFPLIFYRENCADAALDESDIDEGLIGGSAAVLVTGTHLAKPNLLAASTKAVRLARARGSRVILDIDYRPVLWGLTGHGLGEERFVESAEVTALLQTVVPECDLVVGTEEEIAIAGGTGDTLAACRRLRELAPDAVIVGQARAHGLRLLQGCDPGQPRGGRPRAGLSRRGLQRAGGGRRLHERLFARLPARRAAGRVLPAGQRLRRARGLAPRLRPRRCRAGPSSAISSSTARRTPPCAGTAHSSSCTGRRRAKARCRRSWPSPSITAASSRPWPTRPAPTAP